jgi:hypothetical protein
MLELVKAFEIFTTLKGLTAYQKEASGTSSFTLLALDEMCK